MPEWILLSVVFFLMGIGLVGTLFPLLPGTWLIFGAMVLHQFASSKGTMPWWLLLLCAGLFAVGLVVENLAGAAGAKLFGAGKWGMAGAVVGALAGLFFLPLGLLLGPVIGAAVCELLFGRQNLLRASKSGMGAGVGFLGAVLLRFGTGVLLVAIFIWSLLVR